MAQESKSPAQIQDEEALEAKRQEAEKQRKADEAAKKEDKKDDKPAKKSVAYFKSTRHAGLTLQVQKMVKQPDNSEKQEVAEEESFTQYYDTFKGDVVRVGYLRTESPAIAKLARSDENVEEIDEKEYNQAVDGDKNNKALQRAPVPAV